MFLIILSFKILLKALRLTGVRQIVLWLQGLFLHPVFLLIAADILFVISQLHGLNLKFYNTPQYLLATGVLFKVPILSHFWSRNYHRYSYLMYEWWQWVVLGQEEAKSKLAVDSRIRSAKVAISNHRHHLTVATLDCKRLQASHSDVILELRWDETQSATQNAYPLKWSLRTYP